MGDHLARTARVAGPLPSASLLDRTGCPAEWCFKLRGLDALGGCVGAGPRLAGPCLAGPGWQTSTLNGGAHLCKRGSLLMQTHISAHANLL